jgi:hypothetical protein
MQQFGLCKKKEDNKQGKEQDDCTTYNLMSKTRTTLPKVPSPSVDNI